MTRIYIAAPYARAKEARAAGLFLVSRGLCIESTWDIAAAGPESLDSVCAAEAIKINDSELQISDAVLCLAYRGEGGEMYCELTRALIAGKPVYWVSMDGRDVLSAWRPGVVRCASVDDAIDQIAADFRASRVR